MFFKNIMLFLIVLLSNFYFLNAQDGIFVSVNSTIISDNYIDESIIELSKDSSSNFQMVYLSHINNNWSKTQVIIDKDSVFLLKNGICKTFKKNVNVPTNLQFYSDMYLFESENNKPSDKIELIVFKKDKKIVIIYCLNNTLLSYFKNKKKNQFVISQKLFKLLIN